MSEQTPADKLNMLVQHANMLPNDHQRDALFRHFQEHPELADWAYRGERFAITVLSELNRRPGPAMGETISSYAAYDSLKRDLGFEEASAIERVVIEHVALCWLVLHEVEISYSMAMRGDQPEVPKFWDKRVDAAQVRFLRAIAALKRIRKVPPKILEALIPRKENATATADQQQPPGEGEPGPLGPEGSELLDEMRRLAAEYGSPPTASAAVSASASGDP